MSVSADASLGLSRGLVGARYCSSPFRRDEETDEVLLRWAGTRGRAHFDLIGVTTSEQFEEPYPSGQMPKCV